MVLKSILITMWCQCYYYFFFLYNSPIILIQIDINNSVHNQARKIILWIQLSILGAYNNSHLLMGLKLGLHDVHFCFAWATISEELWRFWHWLNSPNIAGIKLIQGTAIPGWSLVAFTSVLYRHAPCMCCLCFISLLPPKSPVVHLSLL